MAKDRITIELKEKSTDVQGISLKTFLNTISASANLLKTIEEELREDEKHRVRWIIVNLEMGSASVEIQGIPLKQTPPHIVSRVVQEAHQSISAVEKSSDPKEIISIDRLTAMNRIAKELRKEELSHIKFVSDGKPLTITKQLDVNIEKLLLSEVTVRGSMDGDLDAINVHECHKFYIFPIIGPKRVECIFPPNLLDDVKQMLKQYVNVSGELHYAKKQKYPHKIIVDKITPLPQDNLPSWEEMRGIAPDITRGLSIEDFIRSIRSHD